MRVFKPLTQAKRWIEEVALPIVRSDRQDLQPACDFVGLDAIGPLMELCRGQAEVMACMEGGTLLLLDDVTTARRTEDAAQILASRVRCVG